MVILFFSFFYITCTVYLRVYFYSACLKDKFYIILYNNIFFIIYVLYFVFQCFIFLDDAQGVADILEKLIKDNEVSGI